MATVLGRGGLDFSVLQTPQDMARGIYHSVVEETIMTLSDERKLAVVAEAINATVALERAQSAAGDDRKRPRYERAVIRLLTLVLGRQPAENEIKVILE